MRLQDKLLIVICRGVDWEEVWAALLELHLSLIIRMLYWPCLFLAHGLWVVLHIMPEEGQHI